MLFVLHSFPFDTARPNKLHYPLLGLTDDFASVVASVDVLGVYDSLPPIDFCSVTFFQKN
jgi:hypothetical protein